MLKTPTLLMYHGIIAKSSDIPQDREAGAGLYDLSVEKFKEQMHFMKHGGFRSSKVEGMTIYDPKKIIMTFDDGEMNNFTNAFPILKESGFIGYFFVTVNRVGQKGYMGWKELEVLSKSGMIIGSHGLTHSILTDLSEGELRRELSDSKAELEKHLNAAVHYFSVPRGFYHEEVVRIARETGYRRVFVSQKLTTEEGEYCLPRTAVKGSWDILRFKLALEGKVPVTEWILNGAKGVAKSILGGGGYDRLRSLILKDKK